MTSRLTPAAVERLSSRFATVLLAALWFASCVIAQAPEGPLTQAPGTPVQQAPPSAIKVRVTLISTPVVVRNNKGEMIHDLDSSNFRITDNGVPQQITHFDLGTDPISMVLLVENSSRITPLLGQLRKTGVLFTQTVLGPSGEGAIVSFNDSVDLLQDFTRDSEVFEKTLAQLPVGTSGVKLYDAMSAGVEMLSSRPAPPAGHFATRKILFILAESIDYGSVARLGEVLRKAQLANATIYAVGLSTTRAELTSKEPPPGQTQSPITPPGTFGAPPFPGTVQTPDTAAAQEGVDITALGTWAVRHAENVVKSEALKAAAAATGGEHLSTMKDRSIEKAIDDIGGELHSQYNLSYTPSDNGVPGYHDISVTVDRKGLQLRARPGYYLP
jgi:VWFA-related protein